MNILLMSTGGGGGNILRSLKTLFDLDVSVTRQTDPEYASRLEGAVTTRFLDTNEFSLSDLPLEERLLIGARLLGLGGGTAWFGDDAQQGAAKQILGIPEERTARSVVVLGYPTTTKDHRPNPAIAGRRPLAEMVSHERFRQSSESSH